MDASGKRNGLGGKQGRSKTVQTRRDATTNGCGDVLCVRFLDDADAMETIRCISEAPPTLSRGAELLRRSERVARRRTDSEPPPSLVDSSSESDSDSLPAEPSTALCELDSAQLEVGGAVRGTTVFGFQRGNSRSHLRRVAEEFAEKSPVKARSREPSPAVTPKRGGSGQPASVGSGRRGSRRAPATPSGDQDRSRSRSQSRSRSRSRSPPPPSGLGSRRTPATPSGGRGRDQSRSRSRSRSPPPPSGSGSRRTPATPSGGRGRGQSRSQSRSRSQPPPSTKTPRTPKAAAGRAPQTPRSRTAAALPAKTPQTVRRQVKLRLSKLKQEDIAVTDDDDDSDVSLLEDSSEDEYKVEEENGVQEEDDDEDENSEEEEEEEPARAAPTVAAQARRGAARRRPEPESSDVNTEDYFSLHSASGPTSNHTLSRLSEPRLSGTALRALLASRPTDHAAERVALLTDVELMFPHWLAALSHGFNILLHGLGSKRDVLERLRRQHLRERLHVVVSGYHPSVTPRHLLQTLLEEALDVSAPPTKLDAQLEAVERRLAAPGAKPLFLLVHSLDGPMMRTERMQQVLARLAQLPRVHVLASVDHINAPLVWDQHKLAQFNFLWFDATTMLPYTEETSYENSLLVRQTADLALSSLRHVFKSLTPNARGIFMLLAKNQVECAVDKTFEGMSLSELYQRCRDAFLVSSQVALRAQLTEFRDHKLIRSRQSHDGVEQLTVPLESALISEFLAGCEDS